MPIFPSLSISRGCNSLNGDSDTPLTAFPARLAASHSSIPWLFAYTLTGLLDELSVEYLLRSR